MVKGRYTKTLASLNLAFLIKIDRPSGLSQWHLQGPLVLWRRGADPAGLTFRLPSSRSIRG